VEDIESALVRVSNYISARALDGQVDQEHIHAYFNEKVSEDPCMLRLSDLKTLLEAAWMYSDLN
jgi:hypothetical protein